MLSTIRGLLRDRRDRLEMLNLQARRDRHEMYKLRHMMASIHRILFPESPTTGELRRVKTGLSLMQRLEKRLGIMGQDFLEPLNTDHDLERVGEILDELPPERLSQLAAELAHLVTKTVGERGHSDPEDTALTGHVLALRLLSGWLTCKAIRHATVNRKVRRQAQDHEDLHLVHIKRLLRISRGEDPMNEGELLRAMM